jgi:hypothetical protein
MPLVAETPVTSMVLPWRCFALAQVVARRDQYI